MGRNGGRVLSVGFISFYHHLWRRPRDGTDRTGPGETRERVVRVPLNVVLSPRLSTYMYVFKYVAVVR